MDQEDILPSSEDVALVRSIIDDSMLVTGPYIARVRAIVNECGMDNMNAEQWNTLNDMIDEDVLRGAYEAGFKVSYPEIEEVVFVRRELKTMERINVKKAMVDRPDLGFKTNCDLMAFRMLTKDVKRIPSIVEEVVKINEAKGNKVHVRGSIVDESTGKMNDIIQYMYVYHADLGYLAEYQIGHPFAPYKFKHDSGVRDGKPGHYNFKKANIKLYNVIKQKLLDGEEVEYRKLWTEAWVENGLCPTIPDEYAACF